MWWIILLFSVHLAISKNLEPPPDSKLIIVLVDGCRWDYVNQPNLKGFAKLANHGVKAEYVKPVFPSNSYPNWYSIVTGLYSESHGFVQNIMYDDERNEFFLMLYRPNSTNSHWWEKAEPLWVTAEKAGIKTALYWWGGCDVEIHGIRPTICLKHRYTLGGENVTRDILNKLDDVLTKFERNEIRLAMVYYGAVDKNGHAKGPKAAETMIAVSEIDNVLDELQDRISQRGLSNEVSIVVTSDHGMTETSSSKIKVINLERFSNDIKYMLYKGSSTMILPQEGRLDELYDDLKRAKIEGLQIFKKEEIPKEYHFKNNRLVLPLFLLADKGYYIQQISNPNKTQSDSFTIPNGTHGYDPNVVEDMRTIFFARGPSLKRNYVSPPIENVDHYNLFAQILHLKQHPNNGSWYRIKDMFASGSAVCNSFNVMFMVAFVAVTHVMR